MTRIVSIGECMVEMAPASQSDTYISGFAGDTLNTAWYLRQLLGEAWSVDYVTAVGTDALSDRMVKMLVDTGIGAAHILRRTDRTIGLYLIELHGGERSFMYWRSQSAARTLAANPNDLHSALQDAAVAYLSGITLAVLENDGVDHLLTALKDFRRAGGLVAFDPNLRPKLWPSAQAMTKTITRAGEISDIVLPSFEDEADWFNDPNPDGTAQRYADLGAGTVVVKNGEGPITALIDGKTASVTPKVVENVVDTTAAGDSFNAGYLAAILSGTSQEAAIKQAAELAAKVVSKRGALVEL